MSNPTSSSGGARKREDAGHLSWLPERELMEVLDLRAGMSVVGIGTPAAHLGERVHSQIGPAGRHEVVEPHQCGRIELRDDSCDVVLLADAWRALDDRHAALGEAARILREGGRLVILERRHEGEPSAALVDYLERHGWTIEAHREAGDHAYLITATVSDESVQS